MQIKVYRFRETKTTILGIMLVGGARFLTCENSEKALPEGIYNVEVNRSTKFGRVLPIIYNDEYPASRGYRMHLGNWYRNSDGCILVGNSSDLATLRIGDSTRAERQLVTMLNNGEKHRLVINTLEDK